MEIYQEKYFLFAVADYEIGDQLAYDFSKMVGFQLSIW